jgi:preprotein translocase subunit SecE
MTSENVVKVAEKERTWVGLTDEEIYEIAWPNGNETLQAIIKHSILQAEQLLKDKNT